MGFSHSTHSILLQLGKYQEAEARLSECLSLPDRYTYNWHTTLYLKAINGLHSGKPKIAFEQWKLATTTPRKFDSQIVDEKWDLVEAALHLYAKCGEIEPFGKFKPQRFFNSLETMEGDKTGMYVMVISLHLLHLLADGDKRAYMKRSDTLRSYIQRHLRKPELARPRYFLHMLRLIEESDYHPVRLNEKTRSWRRKFAKTKLTDPQNEIVPFEKLWDMAVSILKKQKNIR